MRDFFTFCVTILTNYVSALTALDLGSYSYGAILTAIIVVNIFVSSIVIHFKNTNASSAVAPPKPVHSSNKGSRGGRKG